jgi:hypothetical protein
MVMQYAILDSSGRCINRILWDGVSDWQPPEGCTAVLDPDNLHPICQEPQPEPDADPLATLTPEQKAALLALLQS